MDIASIYNHGLAILSCSFCFFVFGLYTTILGPLLPQTGHSVRLYFKVEELSNDRFCQILDAILQDQHYAYLCVLLIPTSLLFVIVNWGGFKYYAHA